MPGSEMIPRSQSEVEQVGPEGWGDRDLPKVALVTPNASLRMGGEAALSLHYFRELSERGLEVHLVSHERNREELEQLFADRRDRLHFASERLLDGLLWQVSRGLPNRLSRATFGLCIQLRVQAQQARLVRRLVRERGVDIVHQVAPVSPAEPSLIYIFGAPVVIGPLNGGINYPPAFRHREPLTERMAVELGRKIRHVACWIIPGKRRARLMIVANERSAATLPRGIRGDRIVQMPEIGIDLAQWTGVRVDRPGDTAVQFLFVGRLVRWKAIDLLLQSWAQSCREFEGHLAIVGDGEERAGLESMARDLGVSGSVTFRGYLGPERIADLMARSDALILPSLIECGGAVVLEAMAMRLPVIANAWGGPAEHLTAECGILLPVDSAEDYVSRLSDAIIRLAKSPELRRRMGEAGRQRVEEHYDWDRKVDRIVEIYRGVLQESSP